METVKKTSQETEVTNGKNAYCVVCKSDHDVVEFKGKNICKPCIAEAIAM